MRRQLRSKKKLSRSLSKPPSTKMFYDRLIRFFTSLRLTVVCLGFAILLVFFGTLAQVDMGLYRVQHEFFQSYVVFWGPRTADWKIPVLPGGYVVGGVLL